MKFRRPSAISRIVRIACAPAAILPCLLAGGTSCSGANGAGERADGSASATTESGAAISPAGMPVDAAADTPVDADDAGSCIDGSADIPALVDAAQCAPSHLVATTPVTIVTPDADPANPTLASSRSGDRFLTVWTDGGWTINNARIPETIWASLVQPGNGSASVSSAIELTGDGECPVAAWNGTDFTVVWGDDSGLRSQEIDGTGALVGGPTQAFAKASANECPASLVATGAGLAVAWYEGYGTRSPISTNVGLVGPNGAIDDPLLLATVSPDTSPNVALAQFQGRTYAAFVEWPDADSASTVVSAIEWSNATILPQTVEPGFLGSFLAAGDELWLTAGLANSTLYAGTPGSPFRVVRSLCGGLNAFDSIASDACGRLVELGIQGGTPAGIAIGFFARPIGWAAPPVTLGNVTASALAGAESTFGLLWYARVGPGIPEFLDAPMSGSLSFTTLSWLQ
jgi:hypothetical protein